MVIHQQLATFHHPTILRPACRDVIQTDPQTRSSAFVTAAKVSKVLSTSPLVSPKSERSSNIIRISVEDTWKKTKPNIHLPSGNLT